MKRRNQLLPQKAKVRSLIHTGLQPGDERQQETRNRFNGLLPIEALTPLNTRELRQLPDEETVETIL
jgi:hypothetical protein